MVYVKEDKIFNPISHEPELCFDPKIVNGNNNTKHRNKIINNCTSRTHLFRVTH